MRSLILTILLIGCLCFLTGFSPFAEQNTVEEIAPVTFLAVKQGEEKGSLTVATLVPPIMNEEKQFFSTKVRLLKQSRRQFNLKYYREIRFGQLRMLFIDEQIAKTGIINLLDTLLTDPEVSPRLFLVLFKGDFEAYAKNQMQKQKDLDYYLYRMFKHYEKENQGEITVTNIHEFIEKTYTPYSDPYMPVFNIENNSFSYEGTGFFRNGKLEGQTEKEQDQFFLLLSKSKFLKNVVIEPLDVSLGEVHAIVKKHVNLKDHTVVLKIQYQGRIDEYRGSKDLNSQADFYELTDEIKDYLEEGTVSLLNTFQELGVDPLEIGRQTLTPASKSMSAEEWLTFWKSAKINVDCSIELEPLTT